MSDMCRTFVPIYLHISMVFDKWDSGGGGCESNGLPESLVFDRQDVKTM